MKKMAVAAKLISVVLYLFVVAGIASSVLAADPPPIVKCFEAFSYAELIFEDLREFVRDELAADDDEGEYSPEEAKALLASLKRSEERLDVLIAGLSGLTDDAGTNEGKTVRATVDYLAMLKNMACDMDELVAYSFDFYNAVMEMDILDEDTDSYDALADSIYTGTSKALELLEKITPPAYLAITHGDLIARIGEFKEFAVDFQLAADLLDPLRIYSCVYRMGRIEVMFGICGDNINGDILLQFRQAERRLEGPISVLRQELSAYFASLGLKKGGE